MRSRQQFADEMRADETGSAGNQDAHRFDCSCEPTPGNAGPYRLAILKRSKRASSGRARAMTP
jgi:hypothetical protein